MEITIRNAVLSDVPQMLEIYSYYVENTAVSFEYEAPSPAEFERRLKTAQKAYPFLVAEENGRVCGYIYAHPFIERAAYRFSCEVTVYLDKAYRGKGIGRCLYAALETALEKTDITNLYVCIGVPDLPDEYLTNHSAEFHRHIGFRQVGFFTHCGYKFGHWYNMIWAEKRIKNT